MPLAIVRRFRYAAIAVDPQNNFYLVWLLTQKQQQHLGENINFLTCWKKYDLCERHLKRIHLTCLTCKLRRVVTLKDPLIYKITIHQVWEKQDRSTIRKILIKNLLSLTEALS
jgi:hypothetical protein